jgi:hypothetical protein
MQAFRQYKSEPVNSQPRDNLFKLTHENPMAVNYIFSKYGRDILTKPDSIDINAIIEETKEYFGKNDGTSDRLIGYLINENPFDINGRIELYLKYKPLGYDINIYEINHKTYERLNTVINYSLEDYVPVDDKIILYLNIELPKSDNNFPRIFELEVN